MISALVRPIPIPPSERPDHDNLLNVSVIKPQEAKSEANETCTSEQDVSEGDSTMNNVGSYTGTCGVFYGYWLFLKNIKLVVILLGQGVIFMAYYSQMGVWPAHAEEIGLSKSNGAMMLSIAGIVELISRPIVGYLCTRFGLNKPLLVAVFGFLAAAIGLPMTASESRNVWFAFAAMYALLGGVSSGLAIPMFVEQVSPNRVGTAAGLFPLIQGLGIGIGPLLLGKSIR